MDTKKQEERKVNDSTRVHGYCSSALRETYKSEIKFPRVQGLFSVKMEAHVVEGFARTRSWVFR